MDFAYSDEQKLLRDSIVRLARRELNEGAIERDRDHAFRVNCGASVPASA